MLPRPQQQASEAQHRTFADHESGERAQRSLPVCTPIRSTVLNQAGLQILNIGVRQPFAEMYMLFHYGSRHSTKPA